ncbi:MULTISPECIES: fumarylacetoacetate hydrolase family protein [unclassified Variovorax]|uniref:fumarylacetoacetate hydrolase family protein n=1 Tax=unclassified Variovorax TaxID=663243 RepID=UPI001BD21AE9|nr:MULTISPECIES: fumarylacetoacetate hydrolase family protein [unclassified Variovorax]
MKLARIRHGAEVRWVAAGHEGLRILSQQDVIDALRHTGAPGGWTDAAAMSSELSGAALEVPFVEDAALFCIGLNYKEHVEEVERDMPPFPSVFLRLARSVVGHGYPLAMPSSSTAYDFEGEVAFVIGKPGRHIALADAWDHVGGFTVFMDGSVRDVQKQSLTAGKNFHASGACGPWIVTSEKISDVAAMRIRTTVNGREMQSSSTDKLIYSIPRIVHYLSTFTELRTGDIIATGTPAGVGVSREPALWLKAGDVVEVTVDGVGALRNTVAADASGGQVGDVQGLRQEGEK